MGRELNNNQDRLEPNYHDSSVTNTTSTDPIQSKLTSPWPNQWQLGGLGDDMTKDPWPDLEGMNTWNDASDIEEPDPTDNPPYTTPWGCFGEPN